MVRNDGEFRKAVEAVAIAPRSGRLTLLTRKLFNTLLFHAQETGESREIYRTLLQQITRNAEFESNDTEVVKEHLRRMMDTRVEWNSPGQLWEASNLLSFVRLVKERGRVYLEWAYPPNIRERLLKPDQYTRLSLQMQTLMRSSASLALYEICLRYATNPSKLTMREPWEWWVPILTGNPDFDPKTAEYKYFKRDVLKPSIAEINTLQDDIQVELIEHKNGRRIADIQFRVTQRPQASLGIGAPPLFDMSLLERMLRLGLPQKEAQELYASTEEGVLRATLDHVEKRQRSARLAPLENAAAYFRTSLRKGFASAPADNGAAQPAPSREAVLAEQMRSLRTAYDTEQRRLAEEMFREQSDEARDDALRRFEAEELARLAPPIARAYRMQGLGNRMVASCFFEWLVRQTWPGEPNEKELLAFALEKGILKAS